MYLAAASIMSLLCEPGVSAYLFLLLIYFWSFLSHTLAPTQRIFLRGFAAPSLTFIELPSLSSLPSHSHCVCAGMRLREQSTNRKSIDWPSHSLLL